jgi:phage terminase large subunit GpA-like protein
MVVQPTVEDAEGFSKEEIAPMLRDCPVLTPLVRDAAKTSAQTILHKTFPGGSLSVVGANSGRGFRRVSRRVVIFDEVDGYPPSAGAEGDQIKLGMRRAEYYWNRKIIAGSTPLVAGASRIEDMFKAGDQRRFYVPCPSCGHRDILVFSEGRLEGHRGHFMQWPKGEPEKAYFVCSANGCIIEDHQKRAMLEAGEWRAAVPFAGHASFHIWAAYSMSPNATWGQIATEFAECKGDPKKLRTFINTVLGETWTELGEAPDWQRLSDRREHYRIGTVPEGVVFLTAGVDVQKDTLRYEVVGWALNKESWSVDAGVIPGDTSNAATWTKLDDLLLNRTFLCADGRELTIAMMAVDSGYNTQQVYNWCRLKPMSRVIACKGVDTARTLISTPSPVDVTSNGKKLKRGYKVWPVASSIAKTELYGWLGLRIPEGGLPPNGYCHFPEYGEGYFKELTAEHLVTVRGRGGFPRREWQIQPGRENHFLDCRVYARAAAAVLGLDRVLPPSPRGSAGPATEGTPAARRPGPPAQGPDREAGSEPSGARKTSGWLSKTGRGRPSGGWLGRRR